MKRQVGEEQGLREAHVDQATVDYYDNHAQECSRKYEAADMSHLDHLLLRHLPEKGARVLELGCGSGREAAFLRGHALVGKLPASDRALRRRDRRGPAHARS
jgi:SAM-dependent methyltransferase